MACVIEDVTDVFDPKDFDKALGDLLIGYDGDAQQYIVAMLDFLKRKTNFFKQGDAKRRVLDAYRQVSGEKDGMKGGFFAASKSTAPKAAAPPAPISGPSQQQVRPAQFRLWSTRGPRTLHLTSSALDTGTAAF
jgi:hypothetical protein